MIFSYENKIGYTYLVGEIYVNDIITGEYLGVVNFNAVKNEIEDYAVKLFKKVKGEEFMKEKEKKVRALINNEIEGFIKPIDFEKG